MNPQYKTYSDLKMITTKNIIELIEKEKILVYFILLWAGYLFFSSIGALIHYAFNFNSSWDVLVFFIKLIDLFMGAILGVIGFKMIGIKLLPTLAKETLLAYFFLLWGASFFFLAIFDLISFGWMSADDFLRSFGSLFQIAAGAVLALFGWNLLNNKDPSLPPAPP
jgi:hypothetical protein